MDSDCNTKAESLIRFHAIYDKAFTERRVNMENEIWKDAVGFEGYQVSNYGNIKSLLRSGKFAEKILKPRQHRRRAVVVLKRDNKRVPVDVAKLVGRAFIPCDKDNLQINHKDGNIFNNAVDNLEWSTKTMKEYMGETMSQINRKGLNEYVIKDNTVYVTLRNSDKIMMCDIEDWENLKCFTWFDVGGYSMAARNKKFHRLVMKASKKDVIDHINRNTYDNRKQNLRHATPQVNRMNTSVPRNSKTGVLGVRMTENGKRYKAVIKVNNQTINLGVYDTLEEAKKARKEGEIKYFKPIIERDTKQ